MAFLLRLLIIFFILWLIGKITVKLFQWWIVRKINQAANTLNTMPSSNHTKQHYQKNSRTQNMIKCEVCGTYVTEASAIFKEGKAYCSKEHLQ